jgi:prepilin-type N-terminal cleavage/methylation domain-containing protein
MKRWGQKGFTIIELLIVVVIIGIIAAIIVVGYGVVQNNARDTALKSDLNKFSDAINLQALDDQFIPDGGMSDTMVGDAEVFNGIDVNPNENAYDSTVSNLYYCAGAINGLREFALLAKSPSGNIFYYFSNRGVQQKTGLVLPVNFDGNAVCSSLGFVTPYTWSVGFTANEDDYGWREWAQPAQ